jgi:hypothetical protein
MLEVWLGIAISLLSVVILLGIMDYLFFRRYLNKEYDLIDYKPNEYDLVVTNKDSELKSAISGIIVRRLALKEELSRLYGLVKSKSRAKLTFKLFLVFGRKGKIAYIEGQITTYVGMFKELEDVLNACTFTTSTVSVEKENSFNSVKETFTKMLNSDSVGFSISKLGKKGSVKLTYTSKMDYIKSKYSPFYFKYDNGTELFMYPTVLLLYNHKSKKLEICDPREVTISLDSVNVTKPGKMTSRHIKPSKDVSIYDSEKLSEGYRFQRVGGEPDLRFNNNQYHCTLKFGKFALSFPSMQCVFYISNHKSCVESKTKYVSLVGLTDNFVAVETDLKGQDSLYASYFEHENQKKICFSDISFYHMVKGVLLAQGYTLVGDVVDFPSRAKFERNGETYIILCAPVFQKRMSVKHVRELLTSSDVIVNSKCIIVANGEFTPQAKKSFSDSDVSLIDYATLQKLDNSMVFTSGYILV